MSDRAADVFVDGLWKENPVFRLLLGMCPVLAVTTQAVNGVGMGLATMFVLASSNLVVSIIRPVVPERMRIPCFIVLIAAFVTTVDLVMKAYFFELHRELGLFIPLIVVNCIILGRAEAFASRNGPFRSILDALGMGLGFTLALVVLGSIREIIGNGSWFGFSLFGNAYPKFLVMLLPPGAFITLGFLMAGMNAIDLHRRKRGEPAAAGH
jgi:electron transport complex protein RnfE